MDEETIGQFLEQLASGAPTPGGGAAAALQAAIGAALVSMVCHLTLGKEKYRAYEETATRTLAESDELRRQAFALAAEDGAAYRRVRAAYSRPRGTDEERQARSDAVQEALKEAAGVPLRTVAVAARVIELCAAIVNASNPNVVSDVGVGVAGARAALDSAALNVTINLASIRDDNFTAAAARDLDRYLEPARRQADEVLRAVTAVMER